MTHGPTRNDETCIIEVRSVVGVSTYKKKIIGKMSPGLTPTLSP